MEGLKVMEYIIRDATVGMRQSLVGGHHDRRKSTQPLTVTTQRKAKLRTDYAVFRPPQLDPTESDLVGPIPVRTCLYDCRKDVSDILNWLTTYRLAMQLR